MKINAKVILVIFVILFVTTGLLIIIYFLSANKNKNPQSSAESPISLGSVPTLAQIEKNCQGLFPVPDAIVKLNREKGIPLGIVESKDWNLTLIVKDLKDGPKRSVSLNDIVRFEFREISDSIAYEKGSTESFKNVVSPKGDPYSIEEVFSHLPIGAQVNIFEEPREGKVLMIYCNAV